MPCIKDQKIILRPDYHCKVIQCADDLRHAGILQECDIFLIEIISVRNGVVEQFSIGYGSIKLLEVRITVIIDTYYQGIILTPDLRYLKRYIPELDLFITGSDFGLVIYVNIHLAATDHLGRHGP